MANEREPDQAEQWFHSGCKCLPGKCKGEVEPPERCVYNIAKTRGPITFSKCNCVDGSTFKDKDGVCLRCHKDPFKAF